MKAKEVMCGDIVHLYINDNGITNEDVEVRYAGENFINVVDRFGLDDEYVEDDDIDGVSAISPVYLHEGIMDKLGAAYDEEKGCWALELDAEESWTLEFYEARNNYTNGHYSYVNVDLGCITINELPCNYLHELQHIFRLIGKSDFADKCKECKNIC